MKIRNGFVSNSSSSSFVLVGFEVDPKQFTDVDLMKNLFGVTQEEIDAMEYPEDVFYEKMYNSPYRYMNNREDGAPDGKAVIGIDIAHTDSNGYFDDKVLDFEVVSNEVSEAAHRLGVEDPVVKIYVGTRVC